MSLHLEALVAQLTPVFSSLSPAKWSPKSQGLVQVVENQAHTSLGYSGISSGSP